MDDTRIEWMRNKVYLGLGITDPEVFDDLLSREDGRYENEILKFLNENPKEGCTMIFYSMLKEEEEEIEVEAGMFRSWKIRFPLGAIFCLEEETLLYEGLLSRQNVWLHLTYVFVRLNVIMNCGTASKCNYQN